MTQLEVPTRRSDNPTPRLHCRDSPNRPLKLTAGLGGPGLTTGPFCGHPQLTGIVGLALFGTPHWHSDSSCARARITRHFSRATKPCYVVAT